MFRLYGFSWINPLIGMNPLGTYETYEDVLENFQKHFSKDVVDVIHIWDRSKECLIKKFTRDGSEPHYLPNELKNIVKN